MSTDLKRFYWVTVFGVTFGILIAVTLVFVMGRVFYLGRSIPRVYDTGQLVTSRLDDQHGMIIRVYYAADDPAPYTVRFPKRDGGYQDIYMSEREIRPEDHR